MSLSGDLIQHALQLVGDPVELSDRYVGAVHLRRAVSASYYALFHRMCEASVYQVASDLSDQARNRVYRSLNHGDIKRVCKDFSSLNPTQPLRDLLHTGVSAEMQKLALIFIKLQEARHAADYDPTYEVDRKQANEFIASAMTAMQAWERIKHTTDANTFVLLPSAVQKLGERPKMTQVSATSTGK